MKKAEARWYEHAKRLEWGVALLMGVADGKATFAFDDGALRSFAVDRCEGLGGGAQPLFMRVTSKPAAPAHEPKREAKREPKPEQPRERKPKRQPLRIWTPDRVSELTKLVAAGTSDSAIADQMRLTPEAIRTKRNELRLRTRAAVCGRHHAVLWTPAEDHQVRELVRAGKTDAEIGKVLGRKRQAVRYRRYRIGLLRVREPAVEQPLKRNTKPAWTPEQDKRLRELAEAGEADSVIASELGRSIAAVRCRRHDAGIVRHACVPWTEAEDALIESDLTHAEVAARIGRTREAVRRRRKDKRDAGRRCPMKSDAQRAREDAAVFAAVGSDPVWMKGPDACGRVYRSGTAAAAGARRFGGLVTDIHRDADGALVAATGRAQ